MDKPNKDMWLGALALAIFLLIASVSLLLYAKTLPRPEPEPEPEIEISEFITPSGVPCVAAEWAGNSGISCKWDHAFSI